MGGQQVGLLHDAGLQFKGHEQRNGTRDGNPVSDEEGEPDGDEEHGGEDGVAAPPERAGGDEVGSLGCVDADPPRGAHRRLCGQRAEVPHREQDDADDLDARPVEPLDPVDHPGDGKDGGGDPDDQGDDEANAGKPLR